MSSTTSSNSRSGFSFDALNAAVNRRFRETLGGPLFRTDAAGLFEAFLAALPEHERQQHDCSACRHFIQRFGGVVRIDSEGRLIPAMWNTGIVPQDYAGAIAVME